MSIAVILLVTLFQSQASNTELNYRITVPPGFIEFSEARATNPDIVDCWAERPSPAVPPLLVMCVVRMRGVLPREAIKREEVPAGSQLVSYPWREFQIQGLRTEDAQNGDSVVALVAQVPLRREAIQLTFAGSVGQEVRADSLMRMTLASLDGETNWLTSGQRSERLARSAGVWVGIGVGLVLVVLWRRRRRAGEEGTPPVQQ